MLEKIRNVNDYLQTFGGALAKKIQSEAHPLFQPGDEWHPRMDTLLREPFQAQADAIQATVETLSKENSALCIGEMGVGKTLIGAAVPYIMENGHPPRVLVMCPVHLTKKWVREVKETVPGAEASIVTSLSDVLSIDPREPQRGLRYYVVSKERAKLSYAWRPAIGLRHGIPSCPDCGDAVMDADGVPVDAPALAKRKHRCPSCDSALWQADNTRFRRYSIADYVKRYLRGYFDLFICDEVHEMKGGNTAQGNAFGTLASACKKTIALTGTLLGGYASHLFHLNYRMNPRAMAADGFRYGRTMTFVNRYGVMERITRHYPGEDNVCSKGKKGSTTTREKPGVSPAVFSNHLMGSTVFLHLQDIALDLPELSEEVVPVDMEEDLAGAYRELEDRIGFEMKRLLAVGSRRLLGAYLSTLLSYPDRPFGNEPVVDPGNGNIIVEPAELPQDRVYPKERELLRIVQRELSHGRRCFVYCTYTNTKDVTGRVREILVRHGIRAEVLRAVVKPDQREAWLHEKVDEGVQVVIANPLLVQTGLDLLDFPNIIFFQTGYSVFTLRQASRRSWRIGQKEPVRILYLHYRGTMQERALELVGKKLSASLAIEGKLSDDGLASMCAGDDMTLLLAKALVHGTQVEGAESVWRALNQNQRTSQSERPHRGNVIPFLSSGLSLERLEERAGLSSYDPEFRHALA